MNNDNKTSELTAQCYGSIESSKPYKAVDIKVIKTLDEVAFILTVLTTFIITAITAVMCYFIWHTPETEKLSDFELKTACDNLEHDFSVASNEKLYNVSNSVVDGKCTIRVNNDDFSDILSEDYVKAFLEFDKQKNAKWQQSKIQRT